MGWTWAWKIIVRVGEWMLSYTTSKTFRLCLRNVYRTLEHMSFQLNIKLILKEQLRSVWFILALAATWKRMAEMCGYLILMIPSYLLCLISRNTNLGTSLISSFLFSFLFISSNGKFDWVLELWAVGSNWTWHHSKNGWDKAKHQSWNTLWSFSTSWNPEEFKSFWFLQEEDISDQPQ